MENDFLFFKKKYNYYGQFGEDFLLWNFFDHKKTGFFIDVGAFDGIYLSNTYSFAQHGWKGICIEPHPEYYNLCRKSRPESLCLNVACVGDRNISECDFYLEDTGLLSGLEDNREKAIQEVYCKRNFVYNGLKKIKIKAETLNSILEKNLKKIPHIDFITIDVEGNEKSVLKGLDIIKYKPRVIIVEGNSKKEHESLIYYLEKINKYIFALKLGVNMFFINNEKDKFKIQSIKGSFQTEKMVHPKGIHYTREKFLKGHTINLN